VKNFYRKEFEISLSSTIKDALGQLNESPVKILFVVDDVMRVLGTITDGDIRRGILNGLTLDSGLCNVMRKNFRWIEDGGLKVDAHKLMRNEGLMQLPVLDSFGRLIDIFVKDDFYENISLPNTVIVMAGGKGVRLGHLTEKCPKPMLHIGDKPILEIILEQCINSGFKNFYFSVNYLKNQIIDYFGDGCAWNVNINYIEEVNSLGTAGSLGLIDAPLYDPILVLNGDVLSRVDYRNLLNFHFEYGSDGTVCSIEYLSRIPYGVLNLKGSTVTSFSEKPIISYQVNAGIYVLNPALLKMIPKNEPLDMPAFLQTAVDNNSIINVFPIHEYWLDIGRPETLERAYLEWLDNGSD
jgi:dTDP-glucose pyrophosphorylase/predicted transcriptional regulator